MGKHIHRKQILLLSHHKKKQIILRTNQYINMIFQPWQTNYVTFYLKKKKKGGQSLVLSALIVSPRANEQVYRNENIAFNCLTACLAKVHAFAICQ